jgi:hypothetical protein
MEDLSYSRSPRDCTVRAFAVITGCTYTEAEQIYRMMAARKPGTASYLVLEIYEALGYKFEKQTIWTGTVSTTLESKLRDGRYLVLSKNHVAAMRDGVLHDWTARTPIIVRELWKLVYDPTEE